MLTEKARVPLYWMLDIGQRGMLGKISVLSGSELYWLASCVIEVYVNPKGKVALGNCSLSVASGSYGFTRCNLLRITIWCLQF